MVSTKPGGICSAFHRAAGQVGFHEFLFSAFPALPGGRLCEREAGGMYMAQYLQDNLAAGRHVPGIFILLRKLSLGGVLFVSDTIYVLVLSDEI
jgi:hypothetical protein